MHLGWGELEAPAVIAKARPSRLGPGALSVQLLPGAEAAVGLALRQQPFGIRLVPGGILALEVGALIPGNAQPLETIQNDPGVLFGASLPVGILDAEDVGASSMPGIQPVEESGPSASDMEVTGGGGSETDARSRHGKR